MLQANLIGNIGADAEVKVYNGREFVAFRVAHNDSFKKEDGTKTDRVMWVDCTMNCSGNQRPAVLPYLKAGAQVFVSGSLDVRVYSSPKDRCMKAGITIHVQRIELIGGNPDPVPRMLINTDGLMLEVQKYYHVAAQSAQLMDTRQRLYNVDDNGWVTPCTENGTQDVSSDETF